MLKLSNTTKRLLRESNHVKGMLADLFDRSPLTISRWIEEDNPALTSLFAVNIYIQEFNISEEEVFETVKA